MAQMKDPDMQFPFIEAPTNQAGRGRMLVSKERQRYVEIDADKVARGSFHTKGDSWLVEPVLDFMAAAFESGFKGCFDPFAGGGDLLSLCHSRFGCHVEGLDIVGGKWPVNDSLARIPSADDMLIVTNPPYLAKYSAARKGVLAESAMYFDVCAWEDLYQIALDRCMEASPLVVAIIPETFINSTYPKRHVVSISVLEVNPFHDTETPVCVVCMDRERLDGEQHGTVYVGQQRCVTLGELSRIRNAHAPKIPIRFNDVSGKVALKAVDGADPGDRIRFMRADQFSYSTDKIKVSSRLMTYIGVPSLADGDLDSLIERANADLEIIREESGDLVFSPFKGNNKAGRRRRRMDYAMARKILGRAMLSFQSTHPEGQDMLW
jgi:hypothetical protein